MTFPHIRAPWLRTFADRLTRRESGHHAIALEARYDSMRDAYEAMQAEANGLDFALLVQRVELPQPYAHGLVVVVDNTGDER